MAPFVATNRLLLRVVGRDVDGMDSQLPPSFTDQMVHDLAVIILSLATVSVVAAILAFYWFVRMRRSFRQDLIMLLIQSDMLKALWLMLGPIMYFTRGPVDSDSTFCQVSAFFLTAAIEASDIAILMIAVHSALYIFRPHRSRGETGLYPYRRYAYAAWVIVPLVLAAVVPMTGARFANSGTYCSLPTRPLWYRTALSWIPRYIIFSIIIVTYTWVYVYLWLRFRRLRKDQAKAGTSGHGSVYEKQYRRVHSCETPSSLLFADHSLLESLPQSTSIDQIQVRRPSDTSSVATVKLDDISLAASPDPRRLPPLQTLPKQERWNHDRLSRTLPHRVEVTKSRALPGELPSGILPFTEPPTPSSAYTPAATASHPNLSRPQPSMGHTRTGSAYNRHSIFSVMNRESIQPSDSRLNSLPGSLRLNHALNEDALGKSRDKVRRQLRLLFVYPLVYIITWIAPFISQFLRYDDDVKPLSETGQPLELWMASMASLSIGAAVDCCFFVAWEQPWRHLRGGFWEGLAKRLRLREAYIRNAGRTREEQLKDARAALDRRGREEAERAVRMSGTVRIAPAREWWDVDEESTP